ncbi:MAG: InlB B-repeat-containing protein [Limisphaerales bacterium]
MKSTFKALALVAVLFSSKATDAQAYTLTVIGTPVQGGKITGGGSYATGTKVTVSIQASTGWYVSGVGVDPGGAIIGATGFVTQRALISLAAASHNEPADYTIITNDTESVTINSDTTLSVTFNVFSPTFSQQPTNQIVIVGGSATLTGAAKGRLPISYQWQLGGLDISGATNSSLVFTNIQLTNAGTYALETWNVGGVSNSPPVTLAVENFLVLTNGQPVGGNVITAAGSILISLQSLYANGSIFYTLDGSQPDFNATQYSGPFDVSTSGTLRAIAYSADFTESVTVGPLSIVVIPVYSLTASAGPGTIRMNPPGGIYESNTAVTIVAEPDSGWTFMSWSGAVGGTNPTNSVTMTQDAWVEAVFGTPLGATVAGTGTVSAQPGFPLYPYGTTVRLSAVPGQGNYFARWGNAASGTQNPLSFTINNANPTVSALFASLTATNAALTVVSDMGGYVAVSPSANEYPIGSTNVLTAVPYEGQQFLGWSGDASGTANPLSLVMDTSKVVNANFSRVATLGISASNKQIQLTLWGLVGSYGIEASTNLSDWVPLFSATNFFGSVQFGDPSAQDFPYRMYKAVAQ